MRHADLCAMPTYVPHLLMRQHTFRQSLTWPYPCTKVDQIRQSKPTQGAIKATSAPTHEIQ